MSNCPSCGRYIGPASACPYCGASIERRLSVRTLQYGSLVLGVVGLAVLWFAVTHGNDIPVIPIGGIQSTMNYAYVRIAGQVDRSPTYNPKSQTLSFWVNDQSGRIMVSAFRKEASALVDSGRVPAIGDQVQVEGTLRIRDDNPSLNLNAPDKMVLTQAEPVSKNLAEIDDSAVLQRVTVTGQVREVSEPYSGLQLVSLRDKTGAMDLAVYEDVLGLTGQKLPEVHPGDSVEVIATVSQYKDTLQLALTSASDLRPADQPVSLSSTQNIASLSENQVDQFAQVQGQITSASPLTDRQTKKPLGMRYTLDDGTGRLTFLVWNDLAQTVPADQVLGPGAEVTVQGLVQSFRGNLEIVPEIAYDLQVSSPATANVSTGSSNDSMRDHSTADVLITPAQLMTIDKLTADQVDSTVKLQGKLGTPKAFSKGYRIDLDDSTGTITVLLWQDVYDQVSDQDSLAGATVQVTGKIDQYQGKFEIVPKTGSDLERITTTSPVTTTTEPATAVATTEAIVEPTRTTAPAPTKTPKPAATATSAAPSGTTIGSITADQKGQFVTVTGSINDANSYKGGFKFTMSDSTGQITLLLNDSVYKGIAKLSGLRPGAKVQANGKVDVFNGVLEIVPLDSSKVTVLTAGTGPNLANRAIKTLGNADLNQTIAVEGTITEVKAGASNTRLTVDDGTGKITVLIWPDVLAYVPNSGGLVTGAHVRAIGLVDSYKGSLEVVPQLGFYVTVK